MLCFGGWKHMKGHEGKVRNRKYGKKEVKDYNIAVIVEIGL